MADDIMKDNQKIEKEAEKVIDEKEIYREKLLKIYEEERIFEKANTIKGYESSEIANKLIDKFSLIDNPVKIYNNVAAFKNYKESYFESISLIRKEMISSKNTKLFYSYLFMVSHYIELVIKAVLINKNGELPNNHDILKIFYSNKDYLTKIGLKSEYYVYCEEQLKQIGKYAATNDFSMCFRFPLDKNLKSKIVTNSMTNIKFNEIEKVVYKQRKLFMIFELLIILSEKYFYEKVYDFTEQLLKEVNDYFEK